ncbi:hypothetical protein [Citrobacter sp. S-77]|uniref:hypothetical protein n=1 Tax=Citrobacter sp. S-77 TaxID=1080067 RepID=UPI0005EE4892|nr:hypothetical protein [Citrobacter sp. S-77]
MSLTEADLLDIVRSVAGISESPKKARFTDYASVAAAAMQREGHALNEDDLLHIRARSAAILAARRRHQHRENAAPYEWKKPDRLRQ